MFAYTIGNFYNAEVKMDTWEKLYIKAKEQYHPEDVSPFIYAHHVVCALEAENGEIFTGCQLFYGEIVIEESDGIVFANCNFGGSSGTQISITNGGLIMYNGCCFKSSPTVIKLGNTATKFVNCYLRDGTAVTIS
jgi:hypothetical protein